MLQKQRHIIWSWIRNPRPLECEHTSRYGASHTERTKKVYHHTEIFQSLYLKQKNYDFITTRQLRITDTLRNSSVYFKPIWWNTQKVWKKMKRSESKWANKPGDSLSWCTKKADKWLWHASTLPYKHQHKTIVRTNKKT